MASYGSNLNCGILFDRESCTVVGCNEQSITEKFCKYEEAESYALPP